MVCHELSHAADAEASRFGDALGLQFRVAGADVWIQAAR
jgi:hypothetical protein